MPVSTTHVLPGDYLIIRQRKKNNVKEQVLKLSSLRGCNVM